MMRTSALLALVPFLVTTASAAAVYRSNGTHVGRHEVLVARNTTDSPPLRKRKCLAKGSGNGSSNGGGSSGNTNNNTNGDTTTHTTSSAPSSTTNSVAGNSNLTAKPNVDTASVSDSEWTLERTILGTDFFNDEWWEWWSDADPTHGVVQFLGKEDAKNAGLWEVDADGDAIMRVETTQTVDSGNRKSIRLHSAFKWQGGMVIMDAKHMPTGCGTWPAWWQNGPGWPAGGEIDIVEGVNLGTTNQVSIHTAPGCRAASNIAELSLGTLGTGSYDSYDCSASDTGNQGCGMLQTDTTSYGPGYNEIGGGAYVMAWDQSGIRVWWHPRNKIPDDIVADKPNPDNWGKPMAFYPASDCDPWKYFYEHISIWDTTLCGDWAGSDGLWQGSGCAASTGQATCADHVRNNGDAFKEAYWKVSYVKYYQSPTSHP